ncbi:proteinaceous RNase P 1, chloroplastic/mitochondrial-like [Syzygium oleosum]|uniref:proteinaceous RNase P 1, chloroplastic/mitochondrial-like n=1 Tax=Syzygium oleosum TaxID=219896 RepID=UPI0024BA956B|nr:proteinaceous RNase P 1, chloroplastic/mitochondrial-like [Syzygium oleosum]
MASLAFPPSLHHRHLHLHRRVRRRLASLPPCRPPSVTLDSSKHRHPTPAFAAALRSDTHPFLLAKLPAVAGGDPPAKAAGGFGFGTRERAGGSPARPPRPGDENARKESLKDLVSSIIRERSGRRAGDGGGGESARGPPKGEAARRDPSSRRRGGVGVGNRDLRPEKECAAVNFADGDGGSSGGKVGKQKISGNVGGSETEAARESRKSRKSKVESPEVWLKVALDMCSKSGDFLGAVQLYDSARKEGIQLGQYHYAVLLYLCASAAVGVVQPAKSGSGMKTLNSSDLSNEDVAANCVKFGEEDEVVPNDLRSIGARSIEGNDGIMDLSSSRTYGNVGYTDEIKSIRQSFNGSPKPKAHVSDRLNDVGRTEGDSSGIENEAIDQGDQVVIVDGNVKKYAVEKGFEIYREMCSDKVPMNEATLTSVARMAMSIGDGDLAFDLVKQMKPLGINPRLRSYGPALSTFCDSGDIEKAFEVEKHMLKNGVYLEEPELQALLRVSIAVGKGDKVYYLLHKLRTSVRKVSPSTADLIEDWFKGRIASRLGKRKWDQRDIREAIKNRGGGWHGKGWLGRGKWSVSRASVGSDGSCKCCGEKLTTIDLDSREAEKFAESVAALALKREKNSSFQKFQKWLDYNGPFEAVIDGANVGLFSQQRFLPAKVKAIVNGIRQKLPSRRWPLIVLHNRHITGNKMEVPVNRAIIDKWRNKDALYLTPTGSNDDWYWLYAAIKFKCLIVTNDEMRDHTFQLLGNDFFPKWKERHQVHFSFSDAGPEFHMPPPCSVVIQESENGHWHIPIMLEHEYEADRTWLCVTRAASGSATRPEDLQLHQQSEQHVMEDRDPQDGVDSFSETLQPNHDDIRKSPPDTHQNLISIFAASVSSYDGTLLSQLDTAERCGDCIIDFQI